MPQHFGALENQGAGEKKVLAGWATVRGPSSEAAPGKLSGQFGSGSPMKEVYGKWDSSAARAFHGAGSVMLLVVRLHPSWVRLDNLQIEAGTKAKLDLWSNCRARRQGKGTSPCCPPGHQDLSVRSDIHPASSSSSLAQVLASA